MQPARILHGQWSEELQYEGIVVTNQNLIHFWTPLPLEYRSMGMRNGQKCVKNEKEVMDSQLPISKFRPDVLIYVS